MLVDNFRHSTCGNYDEWSPILKLLPMSQVGMRRNMVMACSTPAPQPMRPPKVSHMVPVEWLGTLHW